MIGAVFHKSPSLRTWWWAGLGVPGLSDSSYLSNSVILGHWSLSRQHQISFWRRRKTTGRTSSADSPRHHLYSEIFAWLVQVSRTAAGIWRMPGARVSAGHCSRITSPAQLQRRAGDVLVSSFLHDIWRLKITEQANMSSGNHLPHGTFIRSFQPLHHSRTETSWPSSGHLAGGPARFSLETQWSVSVVQSPLFVKKDITKINDIIFNLMLFDPHQSS